MWGAESSRVECDFPAAMCGVDGYVYQGRSDLIRLMRSTGPWVAIFVIAALVLAGCTTNEDEGPEETRHVPAGDGCPDSDPAQPLPPEQHEVERMEDLQCAGQFILVEEGSGASLEVPEWRTGDNWTYQIARFTPEPNCEQEFRQRVAGNGTSWDREVYEMEMTSFLDCEQTPHPGGPSTFNRTRDSLTLLHENGYIHRESMFPLADGKRWAYVNSVGDLVEASVHHEAEYEFNETPQEAWRVELEGARDSKVDQWWGEEAGTMIREHRWSGETLVNGRILDRYERV